MSGGHTDSARSILTTVLSVYVFRTPHPVPTAVFQHVLGLLGVEPNTTRQALHRVAASGHLESVRGRRGALWQLTPAGHAFLRDGSRRLAMLSDEPAHWDGRLLMLMAQVPERDRAIRRVLRARLMWSGFGSPVPGQWISPHLGAEPAAAAVVDELGIADAHTFVARPGAVGAVDALVRRAWDLGSLAVSYVDFVREADRMDPRSDDEMLVALVRLIHRWRRFPFVDPALPAGLLPAGWPGTEAARVFLSRQALWRPRAEHRWAALVDAAA